VAYKVFVNGFPLNASELNTYLMKQSIAVFVDATARDAGITSPANGMLCYLTGTHKFQGYANGAWVDLN